MTDKLDFTDADRDSVAWKKLRPLIAQRIQSLREQNDNNLDAIDTANRRGRIAELKYLLTLAEPAPAIVVDDS